MEKLPALEDQYAGISYLPIRRVDRLNAQRNLSPKKVEKKINSFIHDKVANSAQATAIMFEELCKSSSAISALLAVLLSK